VTKNVTCDSINGSPNEDAICAFVLENILPEDFPMTVTGNNNPNPSQFAGSSSGTNVQLGEGDYVVDEEFASIVQLQADLDATGILIFTDVNDFISDCEAVFSVNNVFENATGTISSGESQTCAVINEITVIGGTVPEP
jgi:hypothetical protein